VWANTHSKKESYHIHIKDYYLLTRICLGVIFRLKGELMTITIIRKHDLFPIPHKAFLHNLSLVEFKLYVFLWSEINSDYQYDKSLKETENLASISRKAITKAMQNLKEKKLIAIAERYYSDGGRNTNIITVL
jgi:hypothetical protein